VRAKAHFEEVGGGKSLISVTELPYQVAKAGLIEKIAELVRDKRIDTISDLRDESDRQGMRMVIEIKRGVEPGPTLVQLYKITPMQSTFNVNMLALVDGEPRVLSLKRTLQLFIEHRQEVITRRSKFELERARQRAHILQGLKIALDHLDAVIATIRKSQTADTARQNLQKQFKLTEAQAQAILELQLRRLAALERRKIEEEYHETLKYIKYLQGLLASPKKILGMIRTEMEELKARYADPRRTRITEKEAEQLGTEDLVPEEDVLVAISQRGYIRRLSSRSHLGGSPRGDAVRLLTASSTSHHIILCSNRGHCFTLRVHQIPDGAQQNGVPLSNLLSLAAEETVTALVDVPAFTPEATLVLCTAQGRIKRVAAQEFSGVRASGLTAMTIEEGDELRWAKLTAGAQELLLVSASGQALRFSEDVVRVMGRNAGGVNAIKLASGDRLVAMDLVEEGGALLVVSSRGYGKRTPLSTYPSQSRYGKGVATFARASAQTGALAAASVVGEDDEVCVASNAGAALAIKASKIPLLGRTTRGVAVMQLKGTDAVAGVVRLMIRPRRLAPKTGGAATKARSSTIPKGKVAAGSARPARREKKPGSRRSPAGGGTATGKAAA
jgi:DNA gyrase subunit A